MKLVVFALILFIVVLISYPIGVGLIGGHELAYTPKAWADFATYIGGLTGPFLSAIALIYIAKTLNSQKDSVELEKLVLKVGVLKDALDRHYSAIKSLLEKEYQSTGVSVEKHFYKLKNNSNPGGENEKVVANSMLTHIAMFSKNYQYFVCCLKELEKEESQKEHLGFSVKISYVDHIAPKIQLFEYFADKDHLPQEYQNWLEEFKSS